MTSLGQGWMDWRESVWLGHESSPYQHTLIEAWRPGWQDVEVLRVSDLHPAFNVAGLFWRPVQRPVLEPEITGWRSK